LDSPTSRSRASSTPPASRMKRWPAFHEMIRAAVSGFDPSWLPSPHEPNNWSFVWFPRLPAVDASVLTITLMNSRLARSALVTAGERETRHPRQRSRVVALSRSPVRFLRSLSRCRLIDLGFLTGVQRPAFQARPMHCPIPTRLGSGRAKGRLISAQPTCFRSARQTFFIHSPGV
jgi:hypothetical protein